MDIMDIKDEKQFKNTVRVSINATLKPELARIFGTGHPALEAIINDIYKKAIDAHKERYQKRNIKSSEGEEKAMCV